MSLKALFTEHPAMVGETYPEHMRTSLSFAVPLGKATLAAFAHAFLPFVCTTTASSTVKGLYGRMTRRCASCASGPIHRPDLFPGRETMPARSPSPEPLLAFDPVI